MNRIFYLFIALVGICFLTSMSPSNNGDRIKSLSFKEYQTSVMDGTTFKGNKPVIIDFYATWCGPCKMLSPILEDLSKEYAGKIDFYKVNVDVESQLARLYSIRSIPVLAFINKDGKTETYSGFRDKDALKRIIANEFGL